MRAVRKKCDKLKNDRAVHLLCAVVKFSEPYLTFGT